MTKKLTHKKKRKIIRGGDMSENISNTLLYYCLYNNVTKY